MKQKRPITGNLEKHGRKWRWRRTINGQHVKVVLEATSEQEAIAQALMLEKTPHLLISDLWERELILHIAEVKESKSISNHYASDRKQILTKAAADMRIDKPSQLTRKKIESWLGDVLDRTDRPATRNAYLTHLRQFTKWLVTRNKLYVDPASEIQVLRTEFKPRNTFLTSANIRKIVDSAKESGDKELELILILGFECGMRHGEISAARASWVDMAHNTITIPATEKDSSWSRKGQAGRRKEVVIEMVKELRQWFIDNGIPSPFLLKPNQPWGKYMYRYDFKKKYLTHMKKCGHSEVTIHDMRRSFGSNRVIAGRSIEQVANWMGIHPNTAWKYYARFTPNTGEIEHGSAASTNPTSPPHAEGELEITTILKQLSQLLEQGLITESDYNKKKNELLDNIR